MDQLTSLNNISTNLKITLKLNLFKEYGPNWSEQKTKSEYTIWSIYKGNVWIRYNHKLLKATAGDVIFFYPGMNYRAYTDESGVSFVFQQFGLETGNGIDILKDQNLAGIISNPGIKQSVLDFSEYCKNTEFIYQNITLAFYARFLSYFSLLTESIQNKKICLFYTDVTSEQTVIQLILSHMNANSVTACSIKETAALFDMSEKYFITYFKLHVGLTPKQYLIMCKMHTAVELLTTTDKKISEIAIQLHYSDQYCFSKAFRKYYHESPMQFRSLLKV